MNITWIRLRGLFLLRKSSFRKPFPTVVVPLQFSKMILHWASWGLWKRQDWSLLAHAGDCFMLTDCRGEKSEAAEWAAVGVSWTVGVWVEAKQQLVLWGCRLRLRLCQKLPAWGIAQENNTSITICDRGPSGTIFQHVKTVSKCMEKLTLFPNCSTQVREDCEIILEMCRCDLPCHN